MLKVAVIVALVLLTACGTSPSAAATPSGDRLTSPPPTAFGSPVAPEVLAPATVLPVGGLCSYPIHDTADGNFEPRFCSDGSINVTAWPSYAAMSPHLLAAGRDAGRDQVTAAMRADSAAHLTNVELLDSYQLAAAYYGWTFSPNPACELLYQTATCY